MPVGINHGAVLGHDAEPVAVAVQGETDFRVGLAKRLDECSEVLRLRRVGMVIRKAPVHLAEKLGHRAAQAPVQPRRHSPGDAVAAVHRDVESAREPYVARDALHVGVEHVGLRTLPGAARQFIALDAAAEFLDVVARERRAGDHHLDAVVLGRVVAPRDHGGAAAAEMMRGEIGYGRRRHSQVDHVGARAGDSICQCARQFLARKASVPRHGKRGPVAGGGRSALDTERSQRAPDPVHCRGRERLADDAANVVGAKDFGGNRHGAERKSRTRRASHWRRPG